jgi:microcompartment protein CcmL/EutN
VDAGRALGGETVVDFCVIPNIDPQVVRAINLTNYPERVSAVGVMEFYSVTASVYGADAAVKAADVELVDVRLGTGIGGKSFVVLTGEVAAVREAVSCGVSTPNAEGMVLSSVVIPSPHPELLETLL